MTEVPGPNPPEGAEGAAAPQSSQPIPEAPTVSEGLTQAPPVSEGLPQAPPVSEGLPQAPPVPEGYGAGGYGAAGYGAGAYGDGQYAAMAVPDGMYYDQESGLLLPQGTQLASVGRRIGAWFLAIPLVIVTLGIGYIIWGVIIWARGQTPALQVLGMRCWRPETRSVATFWWMALREIVGRLADGILGIFTEVTSFVLMVAGRERKSLHDWIAGTVVLHDPDKVLDRSRVPPG